MEGGWEGKREVTRGHDAGQNRRDRGLTKNQGVEIRSGRHFCSQTKGGYNCRSTTAVIEGRSKPGVENHERGEGMTPPFPGRCSSTSHVNLHDK